MGEMEMWPTWQNKGGLRMDFKEKRENILEIENQIIEYNKG